MSSFFSAFSQKNGGMPSSAFPRFPINRLSHADLCVIESHMAALPNAAKKANNQRGRTIISTPVRTWD